MQKGLKVLCTVAMACNTSLSTAACFEDAARYYGLDPALLRAISRTESGGNPRAINRNKDGSYDIGHMQINSRWLTTLGKYGITVNTLYDPCISTYVGAWILAGNVSRLGYNWNAVGAYNAASKDKRVIYAHKVAKALALENKQ